VLEADEAADFQEVQAWAAGLEALHARIAGRFTRADPRRRALAYLRGYVVKHLGDAGAVLVVDETGFLKKGTTSAGVQRQYSGTAGKVDNCQLGGTRRTRWRSGAPSCWRSKLPTVPADARASAEQLAAGVPAEQWIACSAGHGAKGRRLCDWTRIELASPATSGMARWLLLRRRTDGELAFYACYGLAATPLVGLVRVAGTRWAVEEGFQQAKGRSAWTTTRSASGQAGTATPPLRCWRTRSWPSPAPRPAAPSGQRGDTVA